MPLIERIKDAVGVSEQDVTYNYHCRECGDEFEADERRLAQVQCPNCGASGSREISRM